MGVFIPFKNENLKVKFSFLVFFLFFPQQDFIFPSPVVIKVPLTVMKVIMVANDLCASNIIRIVQLACFC